MGKFINISFFKNILNFFILFISFFFFNDFLSFSYNHIFYKNISHISYMIFVSGILFILPIYWLLNSRSTYNTLVVFLFIIFIPLVYLFVTTNNTLIFFLCYELFLLPSFFIIFFYSPNRRSLIASIYFLVWTQIGSFLVFLSILYLIAHTNNFYLYNTYHNLNFLNLFFFIGFGIKIPIWPFHYWLTKTHVEAPTFFSIYLSGFLVKTALYGIWLFCIYQKNVFLNFYFFIGFIGVIDSSIKMWGQVDLKKLVAFATIQEMNLILILFLVGNYYSLKIGFFFILAHTILSSLFFFIVDLIYKRYSTRSVYSLNGIINTSPSLGYFILISCIFFSGIPFTLKFMVEIFLFTHLFSISTPIAVILLIIVNWFGIFFFLKHWFTLLFGGNFKLCIDLNKSEYLFFIINLLLLLLLPYLISFFI